MPTSGGNVPAGGPLEGVRVVELGQLLAGPFTGRLLGDMGVAALREEGVV